MPYQLPHNANTHFQRFHVLWGTMSNRNESHHVLFLSRSWCYWFVFSLKWSLLPLKKHLLGSLQFWILFCICKSHWATVLFSWILSDNGVQPFFVTTHEELWYLSLVCLLHHLTSIFHKSSRWSIHLFLSLPLTLPSLGANW